MFSYFKKAPVKASILAGALAGLSVAGMMTYSGFSPIYIALSTVAMNIFSTTALLAKFTNTLSAVKEWLWPPQPVTIPRPENNPNLVEKREALINKLYQSKVLSIKEIKDALKRLFELRSYSNLNDEEYKNFKQKFDDKYKEFQKKITDTTVWQDSNLLAEARALMVEAALYSDAVLAKVEQHIREKGKKEVSTTTVARRLSRQDAKGYVFDFMWSGIVDLYNLARGQAKIESGRVLCTQTADIVELGKAFYQEGDLRNDVRKIYNCFIKQGFYQRYGNKVFETALCDRFKGDDRILMWTMRDSREKKAFHPYCTERPTPRLRS